MLSIILRLSAREQISVFPKILNYCIPLSPSWTKTIKIKFDNRELNVPSFRSALLILLLLFCNFFSQYLCLVCPKARTLKTSFSTGYTTIISEYCLMTSLVSTNLTYKLWKINSDVHFQSTLSIPFSVSSIILQFPLWLTNHSVVKEHLASFLQLNYSHHMPNQLLSKKLWGLDWGNKTHHLCPVRGQGKCLFAFVIYHLNDVEGHHKKTVRSKDPSV